jgi:hypothetical protein
MNAHGVRLLPQVSNCLASSASSPIAGDTMQQRRAFGAGLHFLFFPHESFIILFPFYSNFSVIVLAYGVNNCFWRKLPWVVFRGGL